MPSFCLRLVSFGANSRWDFTRLAAGTRQIVSWVAAVAMIHCLAVGFFRLNNLFHANDKKNRATIHGKPSFFKKFTKKMKPTFLKWQCLVCLRVGWVVQMFFGTIDRI